MQFNVIIIDDEKDMRMLLKKAIEKVEGFQVIGEAENGIKALSMIESLHPQVVFLDMEMPELGGVECAKRILDASPDTIIIFATGHQEYMSDAFELYAFDYITKPFKMERIFTTLERIRKININKEESSIKKIIRHEKGLEKLVIKNKEGINLVDMNDIIIVQREERSTVVYTSNSSYTTSEGLSEIEEKLDKSQFFRSHKSYIVNLSMINKIYPYGRWTYTVKLKNTDKDALLTYDKYEELKKLFEG